MLAYFQDIAAQFTHPVTATAQILGFIPVVLGFFVFYVTDRKKTLAVKAVCDGLFVIHFFLLNQWTGGVVSIVNAMRGITFSQKGRYRWSSNLFLPILFCLLTIGGSLLGWTGIKSLLPMVGSCLAVIGYWCNEPGLLRKFNFAGISLWLIYGILTMSIPTMINNVVYLVSIARTEIAMYLKKQKENRNA